MSEVLDVLGPRLQHLTELSEDMNYCMMKGEVGPGVIVPIHSHEDRETFTVFSGEVEAWTEGEGWSVLRVGDTVDIPGNQKHAWRNVSGETAILVITSTVKMGQFFNEIGRPVDSVPPGPPQPEVMQHFIKVAISYGYWLGTPDDNAAIGLSMD
ncbi:cupin domain-containing protein [Peribacillus frigoritolerans]|uniref:cupin domain-containing protein n=1 Tax=Peribacillus frigoritolerans TaxID=450367 RepID=UPI00105AA4DB|nr:cupin domain-containing protein [Peribacillus frigoritolerans]TDL76087.1 cupin domain-containing protein [Peribacillus frigoritolerans]